MCKAVTQDVQSQYNLDTLIQLIDFKCWPILPTKDGTYVSSNNLYFNKADTGLYETILYYFFGFIFSIVAQSNSVKCTIVVFSVLNWDFQLSNRSSLIYTENIYFILNSCYMNGELRNS